MTAEYKRDLNHSYLILTTEKTVDTASYPVRMLLGNTVPALLRCRIQGLDGRTLFYYEITSRQSLPSFYENRLLGAEDLQFILGCFIEIMEKLEEYLLDPAQLVLNPDYIYIDLSKKELCFCYLPGYEKQMEVQFRILIEYLLPKIDHADARAVALGYGVYRKTLEEEFHLEDIREELYHIHTKPQKGTASQDETFHTISQQVSGDSKAVWQKIKQGQEDLKKDTFLCDVEERFSWDNGNKNQENRKRKIKNGKKKEQRKNQREKKEKNTVKAEKRKKNLLLLTGCATGTVILMGILIASQFNYLPPVRTQDIFGTAIIVLGIVIFLYLFFPKSSGRKRKEKENLKELIQEAQKRESFARPDEILLSVEDSEKVFLHKEMQDLSKNTSNKPDSQGFTESHAICREIEPSGGLGQQISGMKKGNEWKSESDDFHETVLLSVGNNKGPASLVSKEPGELATIFLNEELTVIGKMKTAADVVIPLPTISRIHAKIRRKDQQYYLTDLNSRNGTAVNGRMLRGEEEYLLQNEDEVDFAQARYIFLM